MLGDLYAPVGVMTGQTVSMTLVVSSAPRASRLISAAPCAIFTAKSAQHRDVGNCARQGMHFIPLAELPTTENYLPTMWSHCGQQRLLLAGRSAFVRELGICNQRSIACIITQRYGRLP
jgi:hypothetical protein